MMLGDIATPALLYFVLPALALVLLWSPSKAKAIPRWILWMALVGDLGAILASIGQRWATDPPKSIVDQNIGSYALGVMLGVVAALLSRGRLVRQEEDAKDARPKEDNPRPEAAFRATQ